jgi:hypothetical protein
MSHRMGVASRVSVAGICSDTIVPPARPDFGIRERCATLQPSERARLRHPCAPKERKGRTAGGKRLLSCPRTCVHAFIPSPSQPVTTPVLTRSQRDDPGSPSPVVRRGRVLPKSCAVRPLTTCSPSLRNSFGEHEAHLGRPSSLRPAQTTFLQSVEAHLRIAEATNHCPVETWTSQHLGRTGRTFRGMWSARGRGKPRDSHAA